MQVLFTLKQPNIINIREKIFNTQKYGHNYYNNSYTRISNHYLFRKREHITEIYNVMLGDITHFQQLLQLPLPASSYRESLQMGSKLQQKPPSI